VPKNPQVTTRVQQKVVEQIDFLVLTANRISPANPVDRGGMVRRLLLFALPFVQAELEEGARKVRVRGSRK
jgi:hypothetical protein